MWVFPDVNVFESNRLLGFLGGVIIFSFLKGFGSVFYILLYYFISFQNQKESEWALITKKLSKGLHTYVEYIQLYNAYIA